MTKPIVLETAYIFEGPQGAKLEKAASQQLAVDPFTYQKDSGENGLVRPPYDLDQLSETIDSNTLHARCVKQKASDVLGRGLVLRAKNVEAEDATQTVNQAEVDRWGTFIEEVETDERGDGSFKERLTWAHEDYESIGWAVLEISRNAAGLIDGLWHIPGHTIRAHADGRRYGQKRGGKTVWFKKFGIEGDVDRERGGWTTTPMQMTDPVRGNEVIVIRNYTPRSDYYGLPDSMPALPAMVGWRAQHMFNVRFFDNYAVPSYAVVIEGATISPDLEAQIMDHFMKIKGDPSRTIVIPIPGSGGDEAAAPKVRFERLSVEIKEASFRMYKQDNALEICIAHGVPPYRVGWPIMGSLGGSTAEEMTAIYNDSIVQPRQETWEQRLNRVLLGEKGLAITQHEIKCAELDMRNESRDLDLAEKRYLGGMATPNMNARHFGLPVRAEGLGGDDYIASPYAAGKAQQVDLGVPEQSVELLAKQYAWIHEVRELGDLRKRITKALDREALSEAT